MSVLNESVLAHWRRRRWCKVIGHDWLLPGVQVGGGCMRCGEGDPTPPASLERQHRDGDR